MQLFLRIPRVSEAFELMVVAHREQRYGLLPYFTHPLEVAETVKDPTEDELVAAILHDVVEDTPWTATDIGERFGTSVAELVELLTKDPDMTYQQNIMRIVSSGNRSAMKIKWADNAVNMNGDKSHMAAERRERLNARYADSFRLLSSALGY